MTNTAPPTDTAPTDTTATPSIADRAAELLAQLLAEVDQIDPTPVTMSTIRDRLPVGLYAEFRLSLHDLARSAANGTDPLTTILAEELADVRAALTSTGFILHTPERRNLIASTAIHLGWSADLTAALLGITVNRVPRWQLEGRPTAPTIDTLAAELAAADREAARQANAAAFALVREQWVATYSAALAFIGRTEATGDAPPTFAEILDHIGSN